MRSCAVCAVVCIARVCRRSRRDQAREPRNAQQYGRQDVLLLGQGYNGADTDRDARNVLADALEQLGYGAENATWRNFYLMGAEELRGEIAGTPTDSAAPDVVAQLSVEQILAAMAIRLDGPRAWGRRLRIGWHVTDPDERHLLELENGVLNHRPDHGRAEPEATLVIERRALTELLSKTAELAELAEAGRLRVEGDGTKLGELLGLLDEPDPGFAIVTP